MKSAGTISISIALRSSVVAIFGLVLMFMTSPLLSALTLACLPFLLVSFRIFSKLNMKYTAEMLTASAQAATVAEECFGSIRTVRSLNIIPFIAKHEKILRTVVSLETFCLMRKVWHSGCSRAFRDYVPATVLTLLVSLQVRSFAKETASTERYGGAQGQVLQWGLKSARSSGFFFGFNSIIGTGSIVMVLWFGARQVRDPISVNLHHTLTQRTSCILFLNSFPLHV